MVPQMKAIVRKTFDEFILKVFLAPLALDLVYIAILMYHAQLESFFDIVSYAAPVYILCIFLASNIIFIFRTNISC